jgi:hypothetical protein
MEFYIEIKRKCSEVQNKELERNPESKFITNFMTIMDDVFETTESFHIIYRDIIQENLNFFSKLGTNKDILLLIFYFKICLNPYSLFKKIQFDFNQFYEENENMTLEEIQTRLMK